MNLEFDSKEILLVFGANVRRAREMQELGISELATSIGYDRGCLSSLEYGEQNVEYITALNLARKLNVSFPVLFSRNYLNDLANDNTSFSGNFIEDDFLLVFIENFQRVMKSKQLKQIEIYGATDVQTAMISRIINRKALNPTIKTLYAMAYTVDEEMYNLFSRSAIQEEI
ncbi:helix-turn-helix domain-containing protein [Holdemania massiliensis]|uniref:helix-turn-helix domain-containing protein n=1 Tax=Holdemania massiliensis TaxID=1468449 RepID=UPI001F06E1D2|nr:helix-turn-helix domain-containing protein [Holdemania massiliensis]